MRKADLRRLFICSSDGCTGSFLILETIVKNHLLISLLILERNCPRECLLAVLVRAGLLFTHTGQYGSSVRAGFSWSPHCWALFLHAPGRPRRGLWDSHIFTKGALNPPRFHHQLRCLLQSNVSAVPLKEQLRPLLSSVCTFTCNLIVGRKGKPGHPSPAPWHHDRLFS